MRLLSSGLSLNKYEISKFFLGFANFYRQFIQGFSQIAAALTLMLKTLSTESAEPRKGGVKVSSDSRAGRVGSEIDDGKKIDGSEVDDGEIGDNEVGKKVQKTSKSKNLSKSKKMVGTDFLTPGAKLMFTKVRQAFLKALILYHFDPEHHIRIETDASDYAIGRVLSQLTSDDLGRWHPVAFFSQKMILAETRYETHNGELLAIIEAFKT